MSRAGKESGIPAKPAVVQRVEDATRQGQELERQFRMDRCYEQCKLRALGRVLFSDIPQVRGVLIANAVVDAMQQAILVANSKIVLPEGARR